MGSVRVSVLSLFLWAEPSVFISALHYVNFCFLSITKHPHENLEEVIAQKLVALLTLFGIWGFLWNSSFCHDTISWT